MQMNSFSSVLKPASLAAAALVLAAGAARADALPTPSMTAPLAANPNPISFDSGFGNIYIGGVASGLAMFQTNHTQGTAFFTPDHATQFDFTNGQVFIQKTDGLVQFYVQAGEYSLPTLGEPYVRASSNTSDTFGVVPVAYLKLVPADNFSIEAGKLPTLVGAEYTFTFQNLNIERGLLWNLEPAVSKGVQANYTMGPLAFSLALTDGAYTNRYNQISGSVAWTISPTDTVSLIGSGDLGTFKNTFGATGPLGAPVANENVYNVIWTHTDGPWSFTPYAQYTDTPKAAVGGAPSTDTWGGAILANYAFSPNWSLGGRIEYLKQSSGFDAVLYGHKTSAWTFTVTPTYQYKLLFARMDLSYVTISNLTIPATFPNSVSTQFNPGPGFGTDGTATGQFRAMLEVGIVF